VVSQVASRHPLSTRQMASIRAAMQLFIEDDIANGRPVHQRRYCDACERNRPSAGFIEYSRYAVCNDCATSYELARAHGLAVSIGQYVRDRRFGEIPEQFAEVD
jgi:formate dehydrogenase maturation protein FdhE